jgi:hypothetical protein
MQIVKTYTITEKDLLDLLRETLPFLYAVGTSAHLGELKETGDNATNLLNRIEEVLNDANNHAVPKE